MVQSSVLYRRIRLVDKEDANLLYPILARYVTDPSTAESVTEIVLSPPAGRRPCPCCTNMVDDMPIAECIEDVRVHQAVETYIAELGLPRRITEMMIAFWQWETSRRNGTLQDQKPWDGDDDFEYPDWAFFNTAAILLLSLCKNVSTLYFGQYETSAVKVFLLKANYGILPHAALQKLQHVEFAAVGEVNHDKRYYNDVQFLDYMRNFHRLPSIETISMDGVCELEIYMEYCIRRVGSMRKLHITRSDISGHLLRQMIQIPKALEELKLSIGGLYHHKCGHSFIESEQITKALRQHRVSLKILDLSLDDMSMPNPYGAPDQDSGEQSEKELSGVELSDEEESEEEQSDEEESEKYDFLYDAYVEYNREQRRDHLEEGLRMYGPEFVQMDLDIQDAAAEDDGKILPKNTIGSLNDFTSLTHLSISLGALLGFDLEKAGRWGYRPQKSTVLLVNVLPPNLEYFCVYDYQRGEVGYFDEQIDGLLLRRPEKFPKLQVVKGVDSMIGDMKIYGDERDGYKPPERDLGWKVL